METTIPNPSYPASDGVTTNSPLLVGLCSPAMGSGKTTVAEILERQHGFVRNPLAFTLKEMTETFLTSVGFSPYDARELILDPELKEAPIKELGGVTPRHLMQTLGTEWGRNCIHENVWVEVCIHRAKYWLRQGRSVVIDDVRFPNEADAIRAAGGIIIRVIRPGAHVTSSHASEGALDSYEVDHQLMNQSTAENLIHYVNHMARVIKS
jgi:hypothetical protein